MCIFEDARPAIDPGHIHGRPDPNTLHFAEGSAQKTRRCTNEMTQIKQLSFNNTATYRVFGGT